MGSVPGELSKRHPWGYVSPLQVVLQRWRGATREGGDEWVPREIQKGRAACSELHILTQLGAPGSGATANRQTRNISPWGVRCASPAPFSPFFLHRITNTANPRGEAGALVLIRFQQPPAHRSKLRAAEKGCPPPAWWKKKTLQGPSPSAQTVFSPGEHQNPLRSPTSSRAHQGEFGLNKN